jgi:diamine N-acetyltransferase
MTSKFQVVKGLFLKRAMQTEVVELQRICIQTFTETFSAANTAENMSKYLAEKFSLDSVTRELNDENAEIHLAVLDDQVIGYLKVNAGQSQTEIKDDKALEIERIYVLKEYHGLKVGQLLLEKAVQIATAKLADYVWLGVWEENSRAINFYKKNGFIEFDKHIFTLGDDEQTDIMLKKDLR